MDGHVKYYAKSSLYQFRENLSLQFSTTCHMKQSNLTPPPPKKKALPIIAKPNLHKKKTLISNIECKNKTYKAQARGLDGGDSKEPQVMKTKGNIFTLSIKIQIASCYCLHEQAIQSILTTLMHLDFEKFLENKKRQE